MKLKQWLQKWDLAGLKVNTSFLELEFSPNDADQAAAWDLYIELLTRVATQRLLPAEGTEEKALESVYALFPLTRQTLKHYGRKTIGFSRIAIIVLNQVVRPFTAKWHPHAVAGLNDAQRTEFRGDLARLQDDLRKYTRLLSDLAGVEDLTDLEVNSPSG